MYSPTQDGKALLPTSGLIQPEDGRGNVANLPTLRPPTWQGPCSQSEELIMCPLRGPSWWQTLYLLVDCQMIRHS